MAASTLRVAETTVIGAWDLEDVSRPRGTLRAYAVAWADPNHKCSTWADPEGGRFPRWGQTLRVLLPPGTAVGDAMLHVEVVHALPEDGTKLPIGRATLRLWHVLVDNYGHGRSEWRLQLKRPSGRPQGKVDVKVVVNEMHDSAPPAAYGVPPPPARRDSTSPPPPSHGQVENSGGMWMGFAVGAAVGVAGVLAGLALANWVGRSGDKNTDAAGKPEELRPSNDDASDDYSEADEDEDEDTEDDSGLAFAFGDEDDAEDTSEDEDYPASEIIDVAYPDDGGGGDDRSSSDGGNN